MYYLGVERVDGGDMEDKWDIGDVVKENLLFGVDIGML